LKLFRGQLLLPFGIGLLDLFGHGSFALLKDIFYLHIRCMTD